MLISAKFLGDNMYGQEIDDDKNSTDWNKAYQTKKGGETKNKVLLNQLKEVCKSYNHISSLHIHFILPGLAMAKGDDVIMYIDGSMLEKDFPSEIATIE